jgi:hypothetical protein
MNLITIASGSAPKTQFDRKENRPKIETVQINTD